MHIRETIKVYMNKWTGFRACRDLGARLMLKEKMILSFAATSTGIVVLTGVLHYYMTASRILKEAEATTVQMVGNHARISMNCFSRRSGMFCHE